VLIQQKHAVGRIGLLGNYIMVKKYGVSFPAIAKVRSRKTWVE
jgi:hypothetical protein